MIEQGSTTADAPHGKSLPHARARGIGHGTARGDLETIFGKTGVYSQSALAARVPTDLAGTH